MNHSHHTKLLAGSAILIAFLICKNVLAQEVRMVALTGTGSPLSGEATQNSTPGTGGPNGSGTSGTQGQTKTTTKTVTPSKTIKKTAKTGPTPDGGKEGNQVVLSPTCSFAKELDLKEVFKTPVASNQDTDEDGVSDQLESTCKTSPTSVDSDGDNISDSDEIFELGTNPIDASDPGDKDLGIKITGFYDHQIINDDKPLIKGVGPKNNEVNIIVTDSENKQTDLGKVMVGEDGMYVFQSDVALKDGTYTMTANKVKNPALFGVANYLYADVLSSDEKNLVSPPVNFTVDTKSGVSTPQPKKLANQALTDDNIIKNIHVEIKDNKPVLVGKSAYGTQIISTTHSIVLTSSLIADTKTGDFSIQVPEKLLPGFHDMYVQAVRAKDTALSKTVKISFKLLEEEGQPKVEKVEDNTHSAAPETTATQTATTTTPKNSNNNTLMVVGGAVVLLGIVAAVVVSRRKQKV